MAFRPGFAAVCNKLLTVTQAACAEQVESLAKTQGRISCYRHGGQWRHSQRAGPKWRYSCFDVLLQATVKHSDVNGSLSDRTAAKNAGCTADVILDPCSKIFTTLYFHILSLQSSTSTLRHISACFLRN